SWLTTCTRSWSCRRETTTSASCTAPTCSCAGSTSWSPAMCWPSLGWCVVSLALTEPRASRGNRRWCQPFELRVEGERMGTDNPMQPGPGRAVTLCAYLPLLALPLILVLQRHWPFIWCQWQWQLGCSAGIALLSLLSLRWINRYDTFSCLVLVCTPM